MTYAFLFPGQGAQHVGMGRDLYEGFEVCRSVFDRANEVLGTDLARLCFEGPGDELRKTVNAQPAIVTHSVAAWTLVTEEGIRAGLIAGHSVGEYSALVAAGVLRFEDAVRLVRRRGELMYEAGIDHPGTMSAVVGLDEETVSRICEKASASGVVQVANLNSPEQIVVSGSVRGVEEAERLAREAGAKRVVRLEVSGAFHSPLMEDAGKGLREALGRVVFSNPRVPVVTNVDGRAVDDAESLRRALDLQLTSPVRWVSCMRTLIADGCESFVELGPGRVLSGLLRRIDRRKTAHAIGDAASLEKFRASAGREADR
ncbi:MAG: ACP S-malonyltransferase [Candidatus Eisenbacteria sp.]|nr:ACP S-malonyltransferase [Candidatus Eisenbacteria bacterium]